MSRKVNIVQALQACWKAICRYNSYFSEIEKYKI